MKKILLLITVINIAFAFQPQTKAELQTAVDLWVTDEETALETYGEINTWDTSLITDMNHMFSGAHAFNGDISSWDVSSVTDMDEMFRFADAFNQDISSWDVSYVVNMDDMYHGADTLSDENKCSIHTAWSFNDAWTYDWTIYCPLLGDINLDTEINITDIVLLVNFILFLETPTEQQQLLSDYNTDGEVNITDVVLMVIFILDQ